MDDENAKRINVDDLAKPEQELSDEEEKNVSGGHSGGINVVMGDGSVRGVSGNTVAGTLGSDVSNPVKR